MSSFVDQPKEQMSEQKKKTSGGVFMTLIKRHPSMTPQIKKLLTKAYKDRVRNKKFTCSLLNELTIEETKDSL